MPTGSKRPYTRKEKQDVALSKSGSMRAKQRRAQSKARPKKRNALDASKFRIKRAIAKGKRKKN